MDLRAQLDDASARYQATWRPVDEELCSICCRRGQTKYADVYAKVCIINRVYMAGLQRRATRPGLGDGEEAVAARLVASSDVMQRHLDEIEGFSALDATNVATIVRVHAEVTRDLAAQFVNTQPQSFVSKYLHFHCPIVPIYDQRAWTALSAWVLKEHPEFRVTEDNFPKTWLAGEYYRTFAARFLVLWEEAQRARPETDIKVIDHWLWEYGGRSEVE